jgi:hypothetical protein
LSKLSTGTASGLLVLIAALVAIGAMVSAGPKAEDASTTIAAVAQQSTPVIVEAAPPAIEGLSASVQRVLESNGKLQTFDPNGVSSLAPEIARVLSFYGATLAIPDTKGLGS